MIDRQLDLLVTQKRAEAKSLREAKIIEKEMIEKADDKENNID